MIHLLDDSIRIPPRAAVNFQAFRRWTRSRDFPERGDYAFLGGELWVDLSMETILHNQLKGLYEIVVGGLVLSEQLGRYFGDRMRLVHEAASLSVEPDGMFVSQVASRSQRVYWESGPSSVEVIGTPDMVLEVVSSTSVQKDTLILRELYAAAGIAEYWLVRAEQDPVAFDILRLKGDRYAAVRPIRGWVKSLVFNKSFRLEARQSNDPLPDYRLLIK